MCFEVQYLDAYTFKKVLYLLNVSFIVIKYPILSQQNSVFKSTLSDINIAFTAYI